MFTKIGVMCLGFLFLVVSLWALPPLDYEPNQNMSNSRNLDTRTYIDGNYLLMFATNRGGLAEDWDLIFNKAHGLYFPYQGSCAGLPSDIHTVLYSAGLILGGKVDGQIRLAIGAFDTPEYVQGPMDEYGNPMPDDPRFKMYKITNDSSVWLDPDKPDCARDDSVYHFDDYTLWQTPEVLADGAPLDEYGNPRLMGTQTLWTVFNDAGEHDYTSYGGGTEPLGIEVQELIWASNIPDEENEIYIQYLLINKGGNTIEDFYVSFWVDPDLGGASDDLVGCDSVHGIFYCYNADNSDIIYGSTPPAWGGQLLYGLVVASPGDSAYFNGEWRQGYRNLGMTVFNKYTNGTDPDIPEQMYGYMQGFNAMEDCPTCPYINPETGLPTKFPFSGNPLTGGGWLDSNPADRRLMANCGPITFYPGDTQQVLFKIAAAEGEDRLFALYNLLEILASGNFNPPEYTPVDSINTLVSDSAWLSSAYFNPEDERWITGTGYIGYPYFYYGANYAYYYYGSLLNPEDDIHTFPEVELRFSNDIMQYAYRYIYDVYNGIVYDYAGYYEVPFTAWDTESNRQLNCAFMERAHYSTYDSTWNIGLYEREQIFIFNSDYSGTDPTNSSINYMNLNLRYDADQIDILYMIYPRLREGHTMDELTDGQRIIFKEQTLNPNGQVDSLLFGTVSPGQQWLQRLDLHTFTGSISKLSFTLSDTVNFYIPVSSSDFYNSIVYTLPIRFSPSDEGLFEAYLSIFDDSNGSIVKVLKLVGRTHGAPDITPMFIEPDPIYVMYKYTVGDTMMVEIYLPDNSVDYSIFDIDLSSVTVNDLAPDEVVIGADGTLGDYLKVAVNMIDFIDSYPLLWDTTEQVYAISGQLNDETPVEELGTVTIIGHRAGDINLDNRVDILDVTYLLGYLFSDGPEPLPIVEAGDMNGDGSYNILDVTYLIRYIYVNGPPPIPPVL